jgi:phosphatidylserine/phosphatidylglycerophosphate/cardiolipin synthase-like enzyme
MEKYSLLNRENFFEDIIDEINSAKHFVVIDSYIWVNDAIGRAMSKALLNAANERKVKVFIRNDLSGSVWEHTPGRRPMFFDKTDQLIKKFYSRKWGLLIPQNFIRLGKIVNNFKKRPKLKVNPIYASMKNSKNIHIMSLPFFNHGKVIVIDGKIIYLGGQCISVDYTKWIDYAYKVKDKDKAEVVLLNLLGRKNISKNGFKFVSNQFNESHGSMHDFFVEFLEKVDSDLYIEMAYLGEKYVDLIANIVNKDINVYLTVSKELDTNYNRNMKFLYQLIKKVKFKSHKLHISLFENEMIHTKGMVTKKMVTLGSNNFGTMNGYALSMNEQNIFSEDPKLISLVLKQFKQDFNHGKHILTEKDIPSWSKLAAVKELIGVWGFSLLAYRYHSSIVSARKEAEIKLKEILNSQLEKTEYKRGWKELKKVLRS